VQDVLIDFEVFKALTAKRLNERHTYNDVIRELLGLDSLMEQQEAIEGLFDDSGPVTSHPAGIGGGLIDWSTGFSARGIFLPNGTAIKATYKQRQYTATIETGRWIDAEGNAHKSPSAAAKAVTGSNVNGLRFWQVKRPTDTEWYRLDLLK
jgi:hypothetical protein